MVFSPCGSSMDRYPFEDSVRNRTSLRLTAGLEMHLLQREETIPVSIGKIPPKKEM